MLASILGLVNLALKFANGLVTYLREARLLEAGRAEAVLEQIERTRALVKEIRDAQDLVRRDPAAHDRLRDKFTRPDPAGDPVRDDPAARPPGS